MATLLKTLIEMLLKNISLKSDYNLQAKQWWIVNIRKIVIIMFLSRLDSSPKVNDQHRVWFHHWRALDQIPSNSICLLIFLQCFLVHFYCDFSLSLLALAF